MRLKKNKIMIYNAAIYAIKNFEIDEIDNNYFFVDKNMLLRWKTQKKLEIPNDIKFVELCDEYASHVIIPSSVESIVFGKKYNQITNIPKSVKKNKIWGILQSDHKYTK